VEKLPAGSSRRGLEGRARIAARVDVHPLLLIVDHATREPSLNWISICSRGLAAGAAARGGSEGTARGQIAGVSRP